MKRNSLRVAANVKTLDEEADLKAKPLSLATKPIKSTNVQFSTKPRFFAKRVLAVRSFSFGFKIKNSIK